MDVLKQLQKPTYWLVGIAATIAALHLTLLDEADKQNLLSLSTLIWLAIASLIWDKRHELKLESDVFSTLLGITLIAIVLLRSISPTGYHLTVSPLICGIGLALMASGVKQLYQYGKELLILFLLALYPILSSILQAIKLPLITAQFSNFILWITGFNSYREGIIIHLPTGSVEVYDSCSGVESIMLMLNIAVLFFLLFPVKLKPGIIAIIIAVFLGFFVNVVRVALMALLVAYSKPQAFEYWHGDDGSLIFAMISVFIFGVFCWFAYVRKLTLDSPQE